MEEPVIGLNVMERHAQTILTLIVVALLVWVGSSTQESAMKIAALEVQVTALHARLNEPDAAVALLIDQNRELRARVLKLESHLHNN